MKTNIYFRQRGKLRVFSIEGVYSHEEIVSLMEVQNLKPDGAVMLTYKEEKSE